MKVSELVSKLELRVVCGEKGLEKNISGAYVSDLLSDVMGNANEGQVWVTLQVHKNIMAVASLKELSAIILVKNLLPNADCMEVSNSEDIPILISPYEAFETAGKLYEILKNNASL